MTESTAPAIPTVFSATVLADDVAEVVGFYVDHFGFAVRLDIGWFVTLHHGDRPYELCVVERGHESVPEGFRVAPAGVIVAFLVDDVDAHAERLAHDRRATVVTRVRDEPWGQRHLYVTDPAGTLVDVVQLTTPSPEWLAANGLATPV